MDKVLIDIDVVQGIISTYHRAEKDQSRIYGIILGSKKDNVYYITEAIYGFIFEFENEKTKKKELNRMNDEILRSLFNSLYQKFKKNNPNLNSTKINKEKELKFQSDDSLMVLGGFVTDKEPFSNLYRFHSTFDKISSDIFPNINKLLILLDPSYKDSSDVKYGIKAYEWDTKSIRIKKVKGNNGFIFFKELDCDIVKNVNNMDIIGSYKQKNMWENLNNLKIDKNEAKNINELLLNLKDGNENMITTESNVEFTKNKIQECISYLNILENILENKDGNDKINEDDLNKIAYMISQLEPVLNDNEIIDTINKDINKKYNVDALAQLLEVQLALSDKIRVLIQ
jgi:hypothetical protein